jgi:hypothetical protein
MRHRFWFRVVTLVATTSVGGSLLQISCAKTIATNVNPCGTVLSATFCDPQQWDLLFADPQDWGRDPTCTIPTLCGEFPAIGEGGTANTTTTTTTQTTPTNTTNPFG